MQVVVFEPLKRWVNGDRCQREALRRKLAKYEFSLEDDRFYRGCEAQAARKKLFLVQKMQSKLVSETSGKGRASPDLFHCAVDYRALEQGPGSSPCVARMCSEAASYEA